MADRPVDSEDFALQKISHLPGDWVVVLRMSIPVHTGAEVVGHDAQRLRSLAEKLRAAADWVEDG